ncbi:MAG: class I SAM-dependent RNA methyltransferase [Chloroflexota bacterium]
MYNLFAVTIPGLEPFTQQELSSLGIKPKSQISKNMPGESKEDTGGVEFDASLIDLYRANLHLRTASRILARLGDFYTVAFSELRKKASRLAWEQFLFPGQTVAIRVTCHRSRLFHSDAVAERVAGAISDRLGKPSPFVKLNEGQESMPQLVLVRLVNDHCMISLDTSGSRLHKRGYKVETAKAPLRETLAAGLLFAAGWDGISPLLDPFCGSGTIPIEAAMLHRRIAPGKNRIFGFMNWKNYDPKMWQSVLEDAVSQEIPSSTPIIGSDRDAGAIRIARANAERAGVKEDIQFSCHSFSDIEVPNEPGWIVTNPPYGIRIRSSRDLRNLYSKLGDVLRVVCPQWKIGILCSDKYIVGHTHIGFEREIPLVNGGIPVKYFAGHI